jgi:hypothetical protein
VRLHFGVNEKGKGRRLRVVTFVVTHANKKSNLTKREKGRWGIIVFFWSRKGLEVFVCVCKASGCKCVGVEEGFVGEKNEWGQTGGKART